jgi:hypothetical protein
MKKLLSSLKIPAMLFTSHNTPHITLGNEQCLKLLLGVCNIKKRGDLSISLLYIQILIFGKISNLKRNTTSLYTFRTGWSSTELWVITKKILLISRFTYSSNYFQLLSFNSQRYWTKFSTRKYKTYKKITLGIMYPQFESEFSYLF